MVPIPRGTTNAPWLDEVPWDRPKLQAVRNPLGKYRKFMEYTGNSGQIWKIPELAMEIAGKVIKLPSGYD